jgi:type I site-specific restriction endonuclease
VSNKKLSERDVCSKFITPAITNAGWDLHTQIREEVSFTKGRIIVRGKLHSRGEQKRADYILYYKSNIPIAIIEAKDNAHSVGAGTPPLSEQHRIVAKVDALMALCDQLKTRIQQANQQQQAIADALVAQAVG